jgi:D-amino peptidase
MDTKAENYHFSLERLMLDTNAAIEGCFEGGASEVYVCDGHGGGNNFIDEMLDKRAIKINCNLPPDLLKQINAFMEVGAHAMPGTINGFLDHVQSSVSWHNYYVNGKKCGELAQLGIYAGLNNIPFVMVSGDEAACVEAKQFFGDIACAAVKYGIGRNKARLVNLDEALIRIKNASKQGVGLIGNIKPYKPLLPLEIKVEFNRSDYCDAAENKNNERLDARTLRKIVPKLNSYMDLMI